MSADLKEFDDLIAALEAERPEIDPAFARELDALAAAGFKKPRRRPRLRLPRIPLAYGAPAAAFSVVLALVVAGATLSGGGGDEAMSGATSSGGSVSEVEPQAQQDSVTTEEAAPVQPEAETSGALSRRSKAGADAAGAAAVGQGRRGRLQELSASLTLVAPPGEIADVGDRILGVVDELGGFVVSSSVSSTDGEGGGGGGDFQLRIPTDRLDDGISRLSGLAHVRDRTQGVLDITSERNVSRERLEEARAERVSLLQRLEEADTDYEVEALRAQIASINDAIGRYRADLRRVVRRAQYAAVSVTLLAEGEENGIVVPGEDEWTPGDALRDAARVLEVIAGVLVIAAAVLIPLALLALLGLAARRVAGRRGRERVLDAV